MGRGQRVNADLSSSALRRRNDGGNDDDDEDDDDDGVDVSDKDDDFERVDVSDDLPSSKSSAGDEISERRSSLRLRLARRRRRT